MTTDVSSLKDAEALFAAEVHTGLFRQGQKILPSKYLYDAVGSALFEVISVLPEYQLTRADERLLRRHARDIVRRVPKPVIVSELGSGSGKKTRPLLEALCSGQQVAYFPIEISAAALNMIQRELGDIHCISIVGLEREYLAGLSEVAERRQSGQRMLVLFLGSTIGNFDAGADIRFLSRVREILTPDDTLLLGADLVKPREQLLQAYDDPAGVTAAFNRNLLSRINRELQANFDLRNFQHEARFNERTSNVEMHLRSTKRQTVSLGLAGGEIEFQAGETIWTESSHKYTLPELTELAAASGFRLAGQWIDEEWPFTENLLMAV